MLPHSLSILEMTPSVKEIGRGTVETVPGLTLKVKRSVDLKMEGWQCLAMGPIGRWQSQRTACEESREPNAEHQNDRGQTPAFPTAVPPLGTLQGPETSGLSNARTAVHVHLVGGGVLGQNIVI